MRGGIAGVSAVISFLALRATAAEDSGALLSAGSSFRCPVLRLIGDHGRWPGHGAVLCFGNGSGWENAH